LQIWIKSVKTDSKRNIEQEKAKVMIGALSHALEHFCQIIAVSDPEKRLRDAPR
jgi:hypothetical protein